MTKIADCCPFEPRIAARTVTGDSVLHLHRHGHRLVGEVVDRSSGKAEYRPRDWHTNGRVSPLGPMDDDLDMRGIALL